MKLNIIGEWFGGTGYTSHTKQFAKALDNLGIEVSMTCNRPADWVRGLTDQELKILKRNPVDSEVNLFIGLPHFWPLYMCEDKPFIGFCVWEGDKVPKGWLEIFHDKRCKQIWVPSNHTRNAILNTYSPKVQFVPRDEEIQIDKEYSDLINKIKLVPEGVDLSIFKPIAKPKTSKLTFITDKGWRAGLKDRGGVSYLIKAYLEEFTIDDNVDLIVKVNTAYGIDLDKSISELDIKKSDKLPKLSFVTQEVPFEKLNEIYNKGDVYISTALAEGFGLGPLQAMACSLPIISTLYGGQNDYLSEDNAYSLILGEIKQVSDESLYEDVKWKVPNIDEIKRTMRLVYNKWTMNDPELDYKKGMSLEIAKDWTWEKAALKAKELVSQLSSTAQVSS